jgi:hypothetical protein
LGPAFAKAHPALADTVRVKEGWGEDGRAEGEKFVNGVLLYIHVSLRFSEVLWSFPWSLGYTIDSFSCFLRVSMLVDSICMRGFVVISVESGIHD